MSAFRTILIAIVSFFFLTGADHQESPIFFVRALDGTAHEFEVVSWSWVGAGQRHAALPGKARAARFQLAGADEALLARWRKDKAVLPKATFESEKSGRLLYFVLSDVAVKSVKPARTRSNVNAVWVTVGFFEANAATSAQNASDSIWIDLGAPVRTAPGGRSE